MNQEKEVWKPLLGYEGRYEVSNYGKIRTLFRRDRRCLRPAKNKNREHLYVMITDKFKIRKKKYVHAAVLESFGSPRPNKMFALHNDGNPLNNHISNLRWGTASDNAQDSIKHGTFKIIKFGENHGKSKLKDQDVIRIRELLASGLPVRKISNMYNVTYDAIHKIKINKNWKTIK